MFMTAWVFEERLCPRLLNEIKKTNLQIYTSPQAGIGHFVAGRVVIGVSFFNVGSLCPSCHFWSSFSSKQGNLILTHINYNVSLYLLYSLYF